MSDYLDLRNDVTYEVSESDTSGNNYETLQQRQVAFVNSCFQKAHELNIEWIFHIDSDELLEGSLLFFDTLQSDIQTLKFQNVEAVFDEKNTTCFSATTFLHCNKGAQCRAYANGKAAGRVVPGVQLAGPHDFSYNGLIDGPHKKDIEFETLHILHYESCSFGSWAEKFKHLSSQNKSDIPFSYYSESIDTISKVYDTYKKHLMKDTSTIKNDLIYKLNS